MHIFLQKYFFINKFDTKILDHQDPGTTIIYRNYQTNKVDLKCIIKLKNYCKINKFKFLISNNFKLALMLNLDGAYIPAFNKSMKHLNFSTKKNFIIIGSAHNVKQLRIKEKQRISSVVISSLFKKNKNYLGLYKFNILKRLTKKKVICLGGINKFNINKLKFLNCDGFAGISYFEKKGPCKRGLFHKYFSK